MQETVSKRYMQQNQIYLIIVMQSRIVSEDEKEMRSRDSNLEKK